MILRFDHTFALPLEEVEGYFRSPAEWPRLFGLAAATRDLGDGWYAVPLARFPFPLVGKNVVNDPGRCYRWVFRGFWKGVGEARFSRAATGVRVEGFERISVRWLFFLSPLVERLFLERRFRWVWEVGWRRLRRREAERSAGEASER